ncbi:MAG TPA: hypothetical protein VN636_15120 [Acidimicrobiia bacterium]|nr:hypothetical protein [Acidimicrobiia bacterium]
MERGVRRGLTVSVFGALLVVGVACGGARPRAAVSVDNGVSSTTGASTARPAAAGQAGKVKAKGAAKPAPSSVAAVSPTTGRLVARLPGAAVPPGVNVLVVPAVPAGGAAPVAPPTAPPPSPTISPATGPPQTVTTVKPYNPSDGIDLSGTPGVTPAQQAAAEALVRGTLRYLPRFADQSVAYAAGYRTIGDAITGDEHWVNWAYANDSDILDPQHPESLVYNTRGPRPVLEAAMFMLPPGSRFTDIPPLFQSPLTQFHVHGNICFAQTQDPLQKVFAGFTGPDGCSPGTTLAGNVPMIHVWIVANPCGPFAALSGVAAGQVPPGQSPNCDTLHAGVL